MVKSTKFTDSFKFANRIQRWSTSNKRVGKRVRFNQNKSLITDDRWLGIDGFWPKFLSVKIKKKKKTCSSSLSLPRLRCPDDGS
jgi:hypothetical protein